MSEKNETLKIEINNIDKYEKEALTYLIDKMVYDGNVGHSEEITFFADGDGGFRPKAKIDDKKLEYFCDRANYDYIHNEHEMGIFSNGRRTYISPDIVYALHEFPDEPMTYIDKNNDTFVAYWVPENSEYHVGDIIRDSDARKLKPGIKNLNDITDDSYITKNKKCPVYDVNDIETENFKNGIYNSLMFRIFEDDDMWQYFKDNMFANVPEIRIKLLEIIFNNLRMYYQSFNNIKEYNILFTDSKVKSSTILSKVNAIYFSFKLIVDFMIDLPDFISLQPINYFSLQPLINFNNDVLVPAFYDGKMSIHVISVNTNVKKINDNATISEGYIEKLFAENESLFEANNLLYEKIKDIFYITLLTNIIEEQNFRYNDK